MSKQPVENSGRRKFLKLVGGGVVLAAVAGGAFVATRTPTKALAPWNADLKTEDNVDPRHTILSFAILAPNPHNRQPWVADLSEDNTILLYCDLDRRLPHTDPFDRQITIGLGCFLEIADLTARELGLQSEITLFPEGEGGDRLDNKPIARIKLSQNASVRKDPLFAHVLDRRSAKEPYATDKLVSKETADAILNSAGEGVSAANVLDPGKAKQLRDIAWAAMDAELRTYRTAKESVDLFRIGKAEIEANPDGIDLGGAFFEIADLAGFMNREEFLDTNSTTFKQQIDAVKQPFGTADGFVFVKTAGNSRVDQIAAGRAYVRINLKATELGVAMQPWSQSLQEFPEVAEQYKAIRDVLDVTESETLQMFARIGYADKPSPSPRWSYETRIRKV